MLRLIFQSLGSDEEAEVPPEDPELVELSARREKRAQERAAEKQRQLEAGSSEEIKEKSPMSSKKSSLHSSVASPRTSHGSVGSGLRPRPSSAFKSEKTSSFQDVEETQQVAVGVQTSDIVDAHEIRDQEVGIQMTGNEAAVQTTSSLRQYGRQGSTIAVGSDPLSLLTPLTTSEEWVDEYPPKTPEAVETISTGAVDTTTRSGSRKDRPNSGPATGRTLVQEKIVPAKEYIYGEKIIQTDMSTAVPEEAIRVVVQDQVELDRGVSVAGPQLQSAGTIVPHYLLPKQYMSLKQEMSPRKQKLADQFVEKRTFSTAKAKVSSETRVEKSMEKKQPSKETAKVPSETLVEEFVEYEEITEFSSPSPKPKSKRRMSFVPNFETPVAVIGTYGQQNRRMSYFPGFEQKEERTRSVLDEVMDPELPTSQTNRDNFIMDEDDDVQDVSPLVSNTSTNIASFSQGTRQGSGASNLTKRSKSPHSRKSRSTNKSNNNASLPQPTVKNSNNNSASCIYHEAKKKIHIPLPEVISPYKTSNALLKRLRIGSRTLTTKVKPKDGTRLKY